MRSVSEENDTQSVSEWLGVESVLGEERTKLRSIRLNNFVADGQLAFKL